mgnify:CR=1 FL=1
MVFIILNAAALLAFIFLTFYLDGKVKINGQNGNSLLIPLLVASVEALVLFLVMVFRKVWLDGFTGQLMRIVFSLDGIFFVLFSFGLVGLASNRKRFLVSLIKIALVIFAVYIVYFRFDSVDISEDYNVYIGSEYLFSADSGARTYFPWTWVTIYNAVFKVGLPSICFVFLTLLQEKKENSLQRYQGLVIGEGIVCMWLLSMFFQYMAEATPGFTTSFMFSYLTMFLIIVNALTKNSIPSGRGFWASIFKFLVCYVIPGGVLGTAVMFLQPDKTNLKPGFISNLIFLSIICFIFALKIHEILSASTRMYTADYAPALEKDLATIDYSGEMDQITNKMYGIFRKNLETSSVNVYILNNKGVLETAYSSNNMQLSLPVNTQMFETLLNENKSVVCFSEIGNKHIISTIDDELTAFFEKTKSDALFVLNEGRNILGLITLGKRVNGDHYKEYDYATFVKLYSYFFVFGYYMRNISNKEIISVVNREIRMSSQIITSIQENIDHIKNEKVDTGYLMVPAHNIGGEFIDFIRLTENRHLFVVGDLSGKGIAASMNMVILKSIIRTYLAETHDFKELIVKINSFIRNSLQKGTIFAGIFGLIDFQTDTMYYINCGIPALMLYTQVYNNVIEIQGSGHVLGFVKDISPYVSVKTTKLNRGDIILACTDGLVQSHSLRGEQFGKERIQQCVLDNSTYPAQRMVQFTFDSLMKFMSKEMEDDVSILVLKYETAASFVDQEEEAKAKEVQSDMEAVADEVVEPVPPETVENPEENATEAVEAPVVEETPVPETESVADIPVPEEAVTESAEAAPQTDSSPFDDPDIPDLSNLDEMLKMAGL